MQNGGWMAENVSPFAETKVSYGKKPELSISISGQLLGCLQGFLIPKSYVDSSPQTERNVSYPIEKNITYGADITLLPESLRKGDCPRTLPRLISQQNNDNCILQSSVEWAKGFSCPLLCSLQQVLCLICSVGIENYPLVSQVFSYS